jgi:hypothetical protein
MLLILSLVLEQESNLTILLTVKPQTIVCLIKTLIGKTKLRIPPNCVLTKVLV